MQNPLKSRHKKGGGRLGNYCPKITVQPVEVSPKYFWCWIWEKKTEKEGRVWEINPALSQELYSHHLTLMVKKNVKILRTTWTEREAFRGVRELRERSSLSRQHFYRLCLQKITCSSRTVCFLPKGMLPCAPLKGQIEALEHPFHTNC